MGKLVMAFDFGSQKIGVAVGQPITASATPIAIIKATNGKPDWNQVQQLIEEWQPGTLVIGLPLNMDGSESEMSRLARKFARRLNGRFNIPFEMMDERLTSFEAKDRGESNSVPAKDIDDIAASLILESWFRQ